MKKKFKVDDVVCISDPTIQWWNDRAQEQLFGEIGLIVQVYCRKKNLYIVRHMNFNLKREDLPHDTIFAYHAIALTKIGEL